MALSDLFQTSETRAQPMSLHEFAFGEPEDSGGFLEVLELLDRPRLAMGESIGAAIRGEDPFAAAKRGIKGEGRYGSLGEQMFELKPGEDTALEALLKQAGAFGADVMTDPTWLVGAPLVGKGAAVAGKVLPSAKTLMRKFPGLARLTLPITTHLRWLGGSGGRKTADLWQAADDAASLRIAQATVELNQAAKQFGLKRAKKLRIAAVDHIESGALRAGMVHPDSKVQQFATYMDDLTQRLGVELEAFLDPEGRKFQIIEPVLRSISTDIKTAARKLGITAGHTRKQVWDHLATGSPLPAAKGAQKLAETIASKLGEAGVDIASSPSVFAKEFYKRPFKRILDYYPHLATPDFLKAIQTDEGFTRAAREMARMNGISEFEAEKILRNLGTPRRAGNIEYARTLNMPGYEKDPLQALPRYFEQVFNRVEYARRFGIEGQILNRLMKRATTKRIRQGERWKNIPGLTSADARLIRDTIIGHPPAKHGLERVARAVMNYQVMTKMGPLSAISNLSQNANTIIREGGVNFLKGTMRGMTSEGGRQGAIAYSGGIHEHLLRMMGAHGQGARWWLQVSGFTPFEKANRILASNTGIVTAERLLRQSKGTLTNNLIRRGLTEEDLPRIIANNWKLPTDIGDRVGLLASNATQHVTRLKDIPLGWQSPEMRMMMQFKSFIYQQTRFLLREIMSPALQFFKTNGKEGTIMPLTRAAAAFGIGGGVVSYARENVKALAAGLAGMEHEPREAVPDDWLLRVLEDSLNMGGLGVAGDLVQRAAQRDFKGWLLGPTFGDISDFAEAIAGTGVEMYKEQELDLAKLGAGAMTHTPFVASVLPRRQLREQTQEGLDTLIYGW